MPERQIVAVKMRTLWHRRSDRHQHWTACGKWFAGRAFYLEAGGPVTCRRCQKAIDRGPNPRLEDT
jgi:hypothetical protein